MDINDLRAISGLDFIRGVLDGRIPAAPIAATIGFEMTHAAEGEVHFRGLAHAGVNNPMGGAHGGWYGVMLDSAMGCAVHSSLPAGRAYTTLEYKVNIIRAATPDSGPLTARGRTRHCGRRTAVADGEIVDRDGRIFATGSTTCLVFEI